MIDPTDITNYELTDLELEEHILFWVCAAGKNGVTAAKCLERLMGTMEEEYPPKIREPFRMIRRFDEQMESWLKYAGIGCFNAKARTFKALAYSNINLRTCSVDELENIPGIGPKTARCFLIHSRPNQRLAGLDVHILRFLKDNGYDVPKSTPTGKKYKQIEQWFLDEADKAEKPIAEFDLEIWNKYRNG